ncbi:MAG: BamA/TamA family outer membrane protein [Bradymonadales bacterium]|nr:BamA/TamA family outer membrane protein [Bradymonadales bacterium]
MTRRVIIILLLLLSAAGVTGELEASGSELYLSLSRIERRAVDRALSELGLQLETSPEGKRFGRLIVINRNIFDPDETPNLAWLNNFHTLTPSWVVQTEVLWQPGDPYDAELVYHSIRNLRRRTRVSVVAMLPVVSSDPAQTVDMLVITRDTFSFHATWESRLLSPPPFGEMLSLPEWNILGIGWSVAPNLLLAIDTVTFGPRFGTPDLAGTPVTVLDEVNLVFNYWKFHLEGTQNLFLLGLPLYYAPDGIGFALTETHDLGIDRYLVGSKVRTFDNPDSEEVERVPFELDKRLLDVNLRVLHGLGRHNRHVLSWGPGFRLRRYRLLDETAAPGTRTAFHREVLPIEETTGTISAAYRFHQIRYESVSRHRTFGFSEDLATGPNLLVGVQLIPTALGSDRNYLLFHTTSSYTRLMGGWIATGMLSAGLRLEPSGGETHDREISGRVTVASPVLGPVRLHLATTGIWRTDRLTTPLLDFGEQTGLRGYATGQFLGDGEVVGQIELRTAPVEILYQLFSLVLFADLGTVFELDGSQPILADVGLGVRWVIPWYCALPLRLDYGIPLGERRSHPYGVISIGTEQAF